MLGRRPWTSVLRARGSCVVHIAPRGRCAARLAPCCAAASCEKAEAPASAAQAATPLLLTRGIIILCARGIELYIPGTWYRYQLSRYRYRPEPGILVYRYCTVQRHREGPDARERGDTHRTRTGAEQHHTPAQTPLTPTPARTAARTQAIF